MLKKISSYKTQIDVALKNYLQAKKTSFERINHWGPDVIDRLLHFVSSGKTIRGCLVMFSHDMFDGKYTKDAVNTACALELIHSGLLIHDDIMDQDRLRRGHKALYVQYEQLGDKRFGESMAICVGDLTFFMGLELVSQHQHVHDIITHELFSVSLAQMQDIAFSNTSAVPKTQDILDMYRYKTARYTFSLPLMIGAMLAEASKKSITQLSDLGENLGMLFQIQDDVLNISGNPAITGKPVGSDTRERKKTLISTIGDTDSTIKDLVKRCQSMIHLLDVPSSYKNELLELTTYISIRSQ